MRQCYEKYQYFWPEFYYNDNISIFNDKIFVICTSAVHTPARKFVRPRPAAQGVARYHRSIRQLPWNFCSAYIGTSYFQASL